MGIAIFRKHHYLSFGAATSLAAASTGRRLKATCGLVLLTQVLTRTSCITIVAMSAQPTAITVRSAFQSAVSLTFSGSSDFGYLLVEQGITSSFGTAGQELNWNTNGYSNIQKTPLYIIQSGLFGGGSFVGQASYGGLWSGTTNSGTNAYRLGYYSSNVSPASYNNRQDGFPVRCINRDFNFLLVQYGIAVNYVGSSNATLSDNGYSNIQNNPIYTTRSGFFLGGSFGAQASDGYSWFGTTYSGTHAYFLSYGSSYVYPAGNAYHQHGFPVRCINRDFNFLLVQYGIAVNYVGGTASNATWVASGYDNIQNNPIYTTRGGCFNGGSFYNQASIGYLWSGTTYSGTNAYILGYNSGNVYPAYSDIRQSGFPVRCIA